MSSVNRESGDDDQKHQSHGEIIEMKSLFKMLVESQNKQAESLAKLADSQANTQQQIIEILKSCNNDSNKHKQQGDIASSSGVDKAQVPADDNGEFAPKLETGPIANYVPGPHNNLLLEAIKRNDAEMVSEYFRNRPEAIDKGITNDKATALHFAVSYNKMSAVEKIVNLASSKPIIFEYKREYNGQTALHTAASSGNLEAAKMMVGKNLRLPQIRDKFRRTPLEYALHRQCVTAGQKKVVEYLYSVTRDEWPSPFLGHDGVRLLYAVIDANFYDIALKLIKQFPELIKIRSKVHDACALELLVRKPYAFRIGTKLTWWEDLVYSLIRVDLNSTYARPSKQNTYQSEINEKGEEDFPRRSDYWRRVFSVTKLYKLKLMHEQATALLKQMISELRNMAKSTEEVQEFFKKNPDIMKEAIKHGIVDFVAESLEHFPHLIWIKMSDQTMLDMAIIERKDKIVSLICDTCDNLGSKTGLVSGTTNIENNTLSDHLSDKTRLVRGIANRERNTILHYAAKSASPAQLNLFPGVAIQVQRELHWLKGVESILPENDKYLKNKDGYTAHIMFREEHKDLLKDGEDWMKDTSGSCMIVAALVATVAFAAAFTVPGGNVSDNNSSKNGTPVFLGKTSFKVFAVADAFALFSSVASILMFLAIYTSRYGEMDFLKSLPQKLIIGLAALFISMAAILVAFCAALFIVIGSNFPRGIIPIALFGCVPVVLFVWLQLPLFFEMVRSTYWGSLFQKHKYIDPRDEEIVKEGESIRSRVKLLIKSPWSK